MADFFLNMLALFQLADAYRWARDMFGTPIAVLAVIVLPILIIIFGTLAVFFLL
jgi:hypothetical protein